MGIGLHELVWAAVLLDTCPDVEVLRFDVTPEEMRSGGVSVPVIAVDVHAGGQADAERLARSLRLPEVEGRVVGSAWCGTLVFRTWRGWVADGSREAAVLVEVTGADVVAGSAVA